jgi:hypothetical protein
MNKPAIKVPKIVTQEAGDVRPPPPNKAYHFLTGNYLINATKNNPPNGHKVK